MGESIKFFVLVAIAIVATWSGKLMVFWAVPDSHNGQLLGLLVFPVIAHLVFLIQQGFAVLMLPLHLLQTLWATIRKKDTTPFLERLSGLTKWTVFWFCVLYTLTGGLFHVLLDSKSWIKTLGIFGAFGLFWGTGIILILSMRDEEARQYEWTDED